MSVAYLEDAEQAKKAMENAYALWSLADPMFESERWLSYQAAVERYNAIVAEANGRTDFRKVELPWLHSHVVA